MPINASISLHNAWHASGMSIGEAGSLYIELQMVCGSRVEM